MIRIPESYFIGISKSMEGIDGDAKARSQELRAGEEQSWGVDTTSLETHYATV